MKKQLILLWCILTAGSAFAQSTVALDDAIKTAASDLDGKLKKGVKIVVLNFKAPTERFSDYVLEELTMAVVNSAKLTVVDRQNLALIQQEMNFQMSGEVSDASAQEIGMKLGAQSIVSGSFEDMGKYYRLRFRTIEVVSAAIQVMTSANVRKDDQTATLLSGASQAQAAAISGSALPHGYKYTTGRKVGAGFLNWIGGIGSFTMGDWLGGLLILGGNIGVSLTIGDVPDVAMGLAVGTIVFGHIRPFSYDKALAKKNGTYYAMIEAPPEGIDIHFVPSGRDGVTAVQVAYTKRF